MRCLFTEHGVKWNYNGKHLKIFSFTRSGEIIMDDYADL